ncbi:MAG: serine hydrolase [Candidatus Eremiobacteraeota bacterium]|nr:serine hydrolase [Candidatus Eremiobacteraeota bacterium]
MAREKKHHIFLLPLLILIAALTFCCSSERQSLPEAPGPKTPVPSRSVPSPQASSRSDSGLRVEALAMKIGKALEKASREFPGILGVSWRDLSSGVHREIRDTELFPAASVIKVPILVECYHRADEGLMDLDGECTIREEDIVGGSGVVGDRGAGEKYTYRELARLMIVKSDNTASDVLLAKCGMEGVNRRMKGMGLENTVVKRKIFEFEAMDRGLDNMTTPRDMTKLLTVLYKGTDGPSKEIMAVLRGQERRDLIPAGLPPGIPIAHKTGELAGTLLDAGIVYYPGRPYALSLMGREIHDSEQAKRSFAELSGAIYRAVKKEFPQEEKQGDGRKIEHGMQSMEKR